MSYFDVNRRPAPTLQQRRGEIAQEGKAIADRLARENRNASPIESARMDALVDELRGIDARIESERPVSGPVFGSLARVTSEPEPYDRRSGRSWFGDLLEARTGNGAAGERLAAQSRQTLERRAVDLNTTAGTGGEFAPPGWFIDQWVQLARPGRVTADLIGPKTLPAGVSSINLPKVATGAAVAVQSSQGTSLQDTALTTTSVTSGILTVGGQQTVALQLLEQSGIAFDDVILADLAAAYAVALDTQILTAAAAAPWPGGGLANVSGAGAVTYTQASPAVAGAGQFYATLAKAIQTVSTTRYMPPSSVVMSPRRWAWIAASFDSQNRPLIVPRDAMNAVGDYGAVVAQGAVGAMLGLPVYTDPNIPTNLGAGTNQDVVYVLREADLNLYESDVAALRFDATYAGSLESLFRVHAYSAAIFNRYPSAICAINGTGLVTPSY